MDATELLQKDHREVSELIAKLEAMSPTHESERQELMDKIATELEVHAQIEEEIFYPELRTVNEDEVTEARHEHENIKSAIGDIQGRSPSSEEFSRKVAELKGLVMHHVQEEEGQMFADARRGLGEEKLQRLGEKLQERKQELMTSMIQRAIRGVRQAARKIA